MTVWVRFGAFSSTGKARGIVPDRDAMRLLCFTYFLEVMRGDISRSGIALLAAYFEPKTGGIAESSLVVVGLIQREVSPQHLRCFRQTVVVDEATSILRTFIRLYTPILQVSLSLPRKF
jgi:hypothetical protein